MNDEIKALAKHLGEKNLKVNGATLVQLMNIRFVKDGGNDFNYTDIQQYYLRDKIPDKYGGMKLKQKDGVTGKYLEVGKFTTEVSEEFVRKQEIENKSTDE